MRTWSRKGAVLTVAARQPHGHRHRPVRLSMTSSLRNQRVLRRNCSVGGLTHGVTRLPGFVPMMERLPGRCR